MPLGFAAFERADGLGECALVGLGEEGVGSDGNDLEGQALADDRLAQEEPDGARHVKPGIGEKGFGFFAEVRIDTNL